MTERMTPSEIEPALDLVAGLGMELIATQKKLKIATEALERISDTDPDEGASWFHNESGLALARIEEVG